MPLLYGNFFLAAIFEKARGFIFVPPREKFFTAEDAEGAEGLQMDIIPIHFQTLNPFLCVLCALCALRGKKFAKKFDMHN